MKLKIYSTNIIGFLIVYFMTKMLWDTLFWEAFEFISLALLTYGGIVFFTKRKHNRFMVKQIIIYFLFVAFIVIDAFVKDDLSQIVRAIYEYLFYLFMVFSLSYYLGKGSIEKTLDFCIIVGLLVSILSWVEYFTCSYLIRDLANSYTFTGTTGFRASVFSRSYLCHGMVLGFFSVIAFYKYLNCREKKYLLSAIFCFCSILATSSRGPLVATLGSLVLLYFTYSFAFNSSINKKVFIVLGFGLGMLIILLFINSGVKTDIESVDYFVSRIRSITDWQNDGANVGRIVFWNRAIEWFKKDVLFGIGPSQTGSWGKGSIGVTESGVLKRLCELGIVGFSIFYIFVIRLFYKGLKLEKTKLFKTNTTIFLYLALVLMVLINDTILQSTEEIQVSFILALGLGGIMSYLYPVKK